MTGIWGREADGWRLLAKEPFAAEAALHDLIEQNPQILPLAGSPQLVIIGREVRISNWYADLIAVETDGRPVIIELKLSSNPEARQAVVAQILTYAAFLNGLDLETFEREVLQIHLSKLGASSLVEAVKGRDQEGSFDPSAFSEAMEENLRAGAFRLVLVLDQAPDQLVHLVGYLETIAPSLLIDLVTVSAFDASNSPQVLVPQRVDPERVESPVAIRKRPVAGTKGILDEGAQGFVDAIGESPVEHREELARLARWAQALETEGLVRLATFHGASRRKTLLPRFPDEGVGLVTIWNDGGPSISMYRTVFERRAPLALVRLEELIAPTRVGQGNVIKNASDEVLEVLTEAYRETS